MSQETASAPSGGTAGLSPLVSLLRCLDCRGELEVTKLTQGWDPTLGPDGSLRCLDCAQAYPIIRGTPRMVRGGVPLDGIEEVKRRTAASFAYEWEHFGAMRADWERNFRDYLQPHADSSLQGKLVLDVGAGSGRHSYCAHRAGARVVAVDLGPSIDVVRRNLPVDALTVQADAEELPFEPAVFDFVMSLGVLHHLPDTERAFRRLVPLARRGGIVHVYLYWVPERGGHRRILRLVELARVITTRLPHRILHPLCYPIAAALYATCVLPYRLLRTRPGWERLAAAFPLKAYADYPFIVCVNDQFDRFSAPLERRFTAEEVRAMFDSAGLKDVTVHANHGWVGSGRRPVAA